MFWIHLLMLSGLVFGSSNGKCTLQDSNIERMSDSKKELECISVDEEQLLTFIKENSSYVRQLKIENSFVPQIEILPLFKNAHIDSLIIRNSRVRKILPLCQVVGLCQLRYISIDFNELRDLHFLSDSSYIRNIAVTHNQLEFLDGSIFSDELRHLDLSFNHIKNFTALRSGLYSLNLSHNRLQEIKDLFKNTQRLEVLDLSYNKLQAVSSNDFKDLYQPRILNLSHNNIHSAHHIQFFYNCGSWPYPDHDLFFIDLSHNKLNKSSTSFSQDDGCYKTKISLENNNLEDMVFLMNNRNHGIALYSMIYRNTKIKHLNRLRFEGLTLKLLDLSRNEIEILPDAVFEGFMVSELYIDHNKIASLGDLSFSGLASLARLDLSYNPLKTVSAKAFENLSINVIDLSHCQLTSVPDTLAVSIFLNHNEIEEFQIKKIKPYLKILDISYNKIKKLEKNSFSGFQIGQYLNLSNNPLSSLKGVFNNTSISNVILNEISLNKILIEDFEGLNKIENLNLSSSGIRELRSNTFDPLLNLKKLYLDDNYIQMIPSDFFGFNVNLELLSMVGNPISFIQLDAFSHKMKLKYLYLTMRGRILKKRFFNLLFLEQLHIIDSAITEVHKYSFKGLISLVELNFKNSTVLKIEPGAFLGLRNVRYFDSQSLFANISILKKKNFVGLDKLETLNLSYLGISTIEDGAFLGLNGLWDLMLSRNKIGDLPKNSFVGLKTLKTLDLSHNNLTGKESTFPIGIFKDLLQLTHLHLQFNRIIKFHIGEFSNLRNLKFLNLSHNQLSYLDRHLLFPLRNLEVLDINSNHVIKFDYQFTLKHLSALRLVGIGDNKWPCENMTIMLNDFEERGVNYREISKLEFDIENMGGIYCVHVCNYLYCPTEDDLNVTY